MPHYHTNCSECSNILNSLMLVLETSRVFKVRVVHPALQLHISLLQQESRTSSPRPQTFDGWGDTFGCAEGVGFREGPFSSLAGCLDSEGVACEFRQSLDLVSVAGSSVNGNKPKKRGESISYLSSS